MNSNIHGLTPEEIESIKQEQLKDFEEISKWANEDCKQCFRRGYKGWNESELRYIICDCVLDNITKAQEEQNKQDADKKGIIEKCRTVFGIN